MFHLLQSSFFKKNLKKIDKKARRTKVFCITFLEILFTANFLGPANYIRKEGVCSIKDTKI